MTARPDEPAAETSPEEKITEEAEKAFDQDPSTDFIIHFDESADLSEAKKIADWDARGQAVYDALKETAEASQADVVEALEESGAAYESYWISNAVLVHDGTENLARTVALHSEVAEIRDVQTHDFDKPVGPEPEPAEPPGPDTAAEPAAPEDPDAVEWGIDATGAPEVWAQGVTGQGIVVASLDTGVDYTHPALLSRFRGLQADGSVAGDYNWLDVAGACGGALPCDGVGHGTHTVGTMVGDAGPGNHIGMAPDAQWIATNALATGYDAQVLTAGQWLLAPTKQDGTTPDPSKRPHVVNNSWGSAWPGENPFFLDVLEAWDAAGIFSTWSAGNEGPVCKTADSPAYFDGALSVGAYAQDGTIASFSARGSGQDGVVKPEISAPGVAVRSSLPGGGYRALDGTSMASPHVAGAVALLWSAVPSLVGDLPTTRRLLEQTAHDVDDTSCGGSPEDNNVWGEGTLDVADLVAAAQADPDIVAGRGTVTGTVTDAAGEPVADVEIGFDGTSVRNVHTGPDGTYSVSLAPGEYTATATRNGYATGTKEVTVADAASVTADFELVEADSTSLAGTVTDATTGAPVPGVTVAVTAPGAEPVVVSTDDDGAYRAEGIPAGSYLLEVVPNGCLLPARVQTTTDDGPVDVALEQKVDAAGYHCVVGKEDYRRGTDVMREFADLGGVVNNWMAPLDLPFDFTHYGSTYDSLWVTTEGWLSFLEPDYPRDYNPAAFPDPDMPHAAVYPYFISQTLDPAAGGVYTASTTVDGQDAFVIEWRDLQVEMWRVSYSVTLLADGEIILGYGPWGTVPGASPWYEENAGNHLSGAHVTIGIENESSTIGHTYSGYRSGAVRPGTSIRYSRPPLGTVSGVVRSEGDGKPVGRARVSLVPEDGGQTAVGYTAADGTYKIAAPVGDYDVVVEQLGYETQRTTAALAANGDTAEFSPELRTGAAAWDAEPLEWLLGPDGTATAEVTVRNTGTGPLHLRPGTTPYVTRDLSAAPAPGGGHDHAASAPAEAKERAERRTAAQQKLVDAAWEAGDPALTTTLPGTRPVEIRTPAKPLRTDATTLYQTTPLGLSYPTGMGYAADAGELWYSDGYSTLVYDLAGKQKRSFDTSAASGGSFGFDMELDTTTGDMCQAFHGQGDPAQNGIRCFDVATGEQTRFIGVPDYMPEAIAYDGGQDVFYVGGSVEGLVATVAGSTHPEPGAILGGCIPDERAIGGLAYNATSDTLWVSHGGIDASLLQIDPATCETLRRVHTPVKAPVGLAADPTGALWVHDYRYPAATSLLDVNDPELVPTPWLSVTAGAEALEPGGSTTVTVSADAAEVGTGEYHALVAVATSAGRPQVLQNHAHLVRSGLLLGVDVGGAGYTDAAGTPWAADQEWSDGSWGYQGGSEAVGPSAGKGRKPSKPVDIAGTDDDPLLVTQRAGEAFSYVFDDAPEGTYVLDLGFAELDTKVEAGERLFDVLVDGHITDELYAVDVAGEVGPRALATRSVTFEHEGGDLSVRFVGRRSYDPPSVGSLRVVHRPDL